MHYSAKLMLSLEIRLSLVSILHINTAHNSYHGELMLYGDFPQVLTCKLSKGRERLPFFSLPVAPPLLPASPSPPPPASQVTFPRRWPWPSHPHYSLPSSVSA